MIAEAGLAALWLAAALALLQVLLAFGPAAVRNGSVREVAVVEGALTLFAMVMLMWVFVRTDLSVLLVAENSHSAKPWLYKLAGAWGNHEGSMLLWVTVLGVAGAVLAIFSRRLEERTLNAALGAQGALALGFFAFLLFASNPFYRYAYFWFVFLLFFLFVFLSSSSSPFVGSSFSHVLLLRRESIFF